MANRMWIWSRPGWPAWDYGLDPHTVEALHDIQDRSERLARQSEDVPELAAKAVKGALLREALATSAIEGEYIPYDDLRTAVTGAPAGEDADPRAAGVVGMLEACRATAALDRPTLLDMHERLLGYLRHTRARAQIGMYRKTEVHIRSHARGIIYEAPGPEEVERLMANFLDWLRRPLALPMNATPEPLHDQSLLRPVKAAVAHRWFECIHPFWDGNGRIGRAIAEHVLRGPGKGAGYLATVIDVRREDYYKDVGNELFQVGVHWIPSSCDKPIDTGTRPRSPSPS